MEFVKRYAMSLVALVVALIVLFWFLNLVGKRAPGAIGTVAEKTGALASGQYYSFTA
jgi:hypothetical protein